MSDQEDFLARWSRRKREIAEEKAQPGRPAAEQADKPTAQGDQAVAAPKGATTAPVEPEFDVSKLPSIDSIGANSDITAFLQAGVPSPLRLAALRRAWVTDPAIRDFVGLAENAWDFTDPNAMPGFGALDPGTDIKRLVAEIFGDAKPVSEAPVDTAEAASAPQPPAPLSNSSGNSSTADVPNAGEPATDGVHDIAGSSDEEALLQRDDNIATQHDDDDASDSTTARVRRHGSAMPH